MILKKLSQYVEQQQLVSEITLAKEFKISQGSIEAMLSLYIQKGLIIKEVRDEHKIFYRWLKKGQIPMTVLM